MTYTAPPKVRKLTKYDEKSVTSGYTKGWEEGDRDQLYLAAVESHELLSAIRKGQTIPPEDIDSALRRLELLGCHR